MGTVNYNLDDMQTVMDNTVIISGKITSTADAIDGVVGGVDKRVYDYFEFFKELEEKSNCLRFEEENANGFGNWMNDTYSAYLGVKGQVEGNSGGGTTPITGPGEDSPFSFTDLPAGTPSYGLTAAAWESFSAEDKKAMEAKLKELGFTDEEIKAIKDGSAVVNKTTLDKLDAALTKLNGEGSDVRDVILKQYGFDVFNDDGTVNKDKLALALIIDGKDPNDEYDLVKLLKEKYGIDLFPEGSTTGGTSGAPSNVTPTTTTDGDSNTGGNGTTPGTVHTGVGFGGDSLGDGTDNDFSEIEAMLSGENDGESSLLDSLGNLTGSVLGGNGTSIGFSNGEGGGGNVALATGAGLLGLGAAAGIGVLAKKKREEDLVDEDEDDDDIDDFDNDEFDEDYILSGESSTEKGKKEKNIKENATTDLDIDVDVTKKKKKWLYKLGIGLAGAGLAAGLLSDDDDDEEDED